MRLILAGSISLDSTVLERTGLRIQILYSWPLLPKKKVTVKSNTGSLGLEFFFIFIPWSRERPLISFPLSKKKIHFTIHRWALDSAVGCFHEDFAQILWKQGLQRDVVYLGWSIAPSYMSPNAGEGGDCGVSSQPVSVHRSLNKL